MKHCHELLPTWHFFWKHTGWVVWEAASYAPISEARWLRTSDESWSLETWSVAAWEFPSQFPWNASHLESRLLRKVDAQSLKGFSPFSTRVDGPFYCSWNMIDMISNSKIACMILKISETRRGNFIKKIHDNSNSSWRNISYPIVSMPACLGKDSPSVSDVATVLPGWQIWPWPVGSKSILQSCSWPQMTRSILCGMKVVGMYLPGPWGTRFWWSTNIR